MKKINLICFVLLLLVPGLVQGGKVAVLTDFLKPTIIEADADQFYVCEGSTIHIYSIKDYKLIAKFGKEGEGPQEFKAFAFVIPWKGKLLVNSLAKVSYFSRDGKFEKEIRAEGMGNNVFFPLDEGYVGASRATEDKFLFTTVCLFDAKLVKGKEVFRAKSDSQQTGPITLLKTQSIHRTHGNRIYVAAKEGFVINVLDHTGKQLFTIKEEDEKMEMTAGEIKKIDDTLKVLYRTQYQFFKDRLKYPDYYPSIMSLFIKNDKIYVLTYLRKGDDRFLTYMFDLKGKLLGKSYIRFVMESALKGFPATIDNGKLYQLIENDEEEWELHINVIK
ncbi:MAG: hypothetical protein GY765_19100 [bacterium]|nr:hypothetical protein [bacterium]